MKNILYVASKSSSRKALLKQAQIPYTIIAQDADESRCDWNLSLEAVVRAIAIYKMDHCILPSGKDGDIIFVLTADTLSRDTTGALSGKPVDFADAVAKLKAACGINTCGTAFCLDKKRYIQGVWQTVDCIVEYVESYYEWDIPEKDIESYITISGSLAAAGAIRIEGYGGQFLKKIDGSYTTIVGLPMFQLRIALQKIGFYS